MRKKHLKNNSFNIVGSKTAEHLLTKLHEIFKFANKSGMQTDFMSDVLKMFLSFAQCDMVELRKMEKGLCYVYEAFSAPNPSFQIRKIPYLYKQEVDTTDSYDLGSSYIESLYKSVIEGRIRPGESFITKKGSFWTEDVKHTLPCILEKKHIKYIQEIENSAYYNSIIIIPITVNNENVGLLDLKSRQKKYFKENDVLFYEKIVQLLEDVLLYQGTQTALNERIKELTCLYNIAQLTKNSAISLKDVFQKIVELLPPAWQYPEKTAACITFDGHSYFTKNFEKSRLKQSADIAVEGELRGKIEIIFTGSKPPLDKDIFLQEEQKLLDTIAHQVSLIIEQLQADEAQQRLQDQLRHADRLATIGQLSAGIAHELNEPLNNILGLCTLTEEASELPEQLAEDIREISALSLQAREIIKKLMLFARQVPPQKIKVNLNKVVDEGLYLLERHCKSNGIELVRILSPDLPEITADPSQLNQVLVNLVVNAIQAMPDGGNLTIETITEKEHVKLVVKDTGVGMSELVRKQIFIPFYTTKDIDKGTGLGLPVVHGIITSHGGTIEVESIAGEGACFEVKLPLKSVERNVKDSNNVIVK